MSADFRSGAIYTGLRLYFVLKYQTLNPKQFRVQAMSTEFPEGPYIAI